MRVAVLASGGKDSSYSTWWSGLQGWDVVCLVTVGVTGGDSLMFQLDNTAVAGLQASAMGVPWLPVSSKGSEDLEIADLEGAICGNSNPDEALKEIWPDQFVMPPGLSLQYRKLEIDGIVTGALRSDYQRTRVEMMCERIGVRSFNPLWHKSPNRHMRCLLDHGFGVVFTSVSTEGMDDSWIGMKLDSDSLERLEDLSNQYRFNLDGEGGEFETIVVNAPHMNGKISFDGDTIWDGSRGMLKLNWCSLEGYR